jgi:hypothetical protein
MYVLVSNANVRVRAAYLGYDVAIIFGVHKNTATSL